MNVNPGKLDKKIEIVAEKLGGKNEAGFRQEKELEVVRRCWASFKRTSGTEQIKSGKEVTDVKCRFLVRRTKKELNRKMMVRYAGSLYDILYVNDYEDSHEYVEIWCQEAV